MTQEHLTRRPIKDLLDRDVEKPLLEKIYETNAVATGQLRRDPVTLLRITAGFNNLTSRNLDPDTLLRYMFNRRKAADWPRLGKKAKKFVSVLDLLTDSQLAILKRIYIDLDETSDNILFSPEAMDAIAQRFHGLAGKHIPGYQLVAVIFAKRKRGAWVKIREDFADVEFFASS